MIQVYGNTIGIGTLVDGHMDDELLVLGPWLNPKP